MVVVNVCRGEYQFSQSRQTELSRLIVSRSQRLELNHYGDTLSTRRIYRSPTLLEASDDGFGFARANNSALRK
jgi:hypothetical protein